MKERRRLKEPWLGVATSWAVIFASFGLSAATWIELAELTHFEAKLTWLLPVVVDGYVVMSLVTWMFPISDSLANFAKKNTYVAAIVGVVSQSAYHCFIVWTATHTPWKGILALVVGALPPALAALAIHMRALLRREVQKGAKTAEKPAEVPVVPQTAPEPVKTVERVVAAPKPSVPVSDHQDDAERNGKRGPVVGTEERKAAARQAWRASVTNGTPLTGAQLGERYGMGERWGRERIKEAKTLVAV